MQVSNGLTVATDRLGSVHANSNGETFRYYPYGEEKTSTADGRDKFGTYFRDSATQDYADQRYYGAGTGRFLSVDPFLGSERSGDPGSWNRYAYVQGDPANHGDPNGTDMIDASGTDFMGSDGEQCILDGITTPCSWISTKAAVMYNGPTLYLNAAGGATAVNFDANGTVENILLTPQFGAPSNPPTPAPNPQPSDPCKNSPNTFCTVATGTSTPSQSLAPNPAPITIAEEILRTLRTVFSIPIVPILILATPASTSSCDTLSCRQNSLQLNELESSAGPNNKWTWPHAGSFVAQHVMTRPPNDMRPV